MTQEEQKILDGIIERFKNKAAGDKKLLKLREKLENKELTWKDVKEYSDEIGKLSSEALQESAEEITALGPGNGYFAVMSALQKNSYEYVTTYTEALIKLQNEQVGIGINASKPVFNGNKASGIASKAAHGKTADETRNKLGTPVRTFTDSVVNDTIEENARTQAKAGITPIVTRTGGRKCCDWCEARTGHWTYGEQPSDFFRQHANCTCMIEFSTKKIRYRINGVHNAGYGVSQKGWGTKITGKELEEKIQGLRENDINIQAGVPEHKKPVRVTKIDVESREEIEKEINDFYESCRELSEENAIVITKSGEVFRCFGTENAVWPDADLGEEINGAIIAHNHLDKYTEYTFSGSDINLFVNSNIRELYGEDSGFRYVLNRDGNVDSPEEDWMNEVNFRHNMIIENAKKTGIGYRRYKV